MPSLQEGRYWSHNVCVMKNKIFVLGGYRTTTCEMLDLSEDDPSWRYIANMNSFHSDGGAVVIDEKVYVLGGGGGGGGSNSVEPQVTSSVEAYNIDQGISSRLKGFSAMHILESFSCRLDVKKLQMC